jgi:hypothetical protein
MPVSKRSSDNLTPFQEQQEITIQRARQLAPNDDRLVESSGDDEVRAVSFALACEMLDEAG